MHNLIPYITVLHHMVFSVYLVPDRRVPEPVQHVEVHDTDEDEWDGVAGHEEGDLETGLGKRVVCEAAPVPDFSRLRRDLSRNINTSLSTHEKLFALRQIKRLLQSRNHTWI